MRALAELDERQREEAMRRWSVLRPAVEDAIALAVAARDAGVAVRTAQRWMARYRRAGLNGLARSPRSDRGRRRLPDELVAVIEALALRRPRPTVATIARRAARISQEQGWPQASYASVYAIVAALDSQLMTLAHEGPEALRDRYELVYRHEAAEPNALWQADHTELDIQVIDADQTVRRPWLTLIVDDLSRAVAGYSVFLGAPSALNLSLALRQAIRPKSSPTWVVHGLPDTLYVDHGSDFISIHLQQVAADLHIRLIHSTVARPQGRGKVERLFGTITTELLPELPGHLVCGRPASPPRLTLAQLDDALGTWISDVYHRRAHSETGAEPQRAWVADGWLARMPDTLEQLDELLVMVAKPRVVHRDGIRFEGLRFLSPTLAAYVGQPVTIRYDPRDLGEIRVFHNNRFVCRAISRDHAGKALTLKDIQAARAAHRRELRAQLTARQARVNEYLPMHQPSPAPPPDQAPGPRRRAVERLLIYEEDKP